MATTSASTPSSRRPRSPTACCRRARPAGCSTSSPARLRSPAPGRSPTSSSSATFDVRSPAQQARSDELRARLEQALVDAGHADRIPLLDAANGQAILLFANPPLPAEVGDLLQEYVTLRLPTAVFLAPPFVPVLPLA